ncbi:hypothetical protein J7315_22400, partial [Providencia rettgeri]|uniref:hypothetical protein n=1 Tax=Providencia rettgeri TaxID=587 RepID=UPI001B369BD7
INDSFYYINIDKSILEDSSGRWGASALEGISGSGIFLKSHKQLVIVGIVSSIPDDGMLGKIKCCNSYFFTNLKPSLIKHDNLEYNFGINHIHQEISSIKDSNLDSIISEWENNPDNKEYNENINRKLSVLHVPNKVKQEKTKIIRNLLLGDIFLSERINNYPNIELAYSESHQIFSDDDMTIYTNNRISANEKYHEIRKDYLEILLDTLKPHGLMKDKIQLLRNKDIAFWLANCDLDFLDDK